MSQSTATILAVGMDNCRDKLAVGRDNCRDKCPNPPAQFWRWVGTIVSYIDSRPSPTLKVTSRPASASAAGKNLQSEHVVVVVTRVYVWKVDSWHFDPGRAAVT